MQGGVLHVRSPILYTPTGGRSQPKPQCAFWGRLELRSFLPEDCVHNIAVRIVEGLPYGFILGARFFYANKSILNFGTDKGFKPTPASPWVPFLDKNMTASNPLAEARTTPLSRVPPSRKNRTARSSGARSTITAPRTGGYSTRTTIGRSCHDKSCTEWPEHTRTTLRDSTPKPSESVTCLVCNWPQQQTRSLHSFLFVCFVLFFSSDSKTPTCFRDRVSFLPTECASVRCHDFNTDDRYPSHVDSYQ